MTAPGGKTPGNGSKQSPTLSRQQQRGEERLRGLRESFSAIASEMRRVTWPAREEWISATVVTVAIVVLVAIWTVLVSRFAELVFKIPQ